MMMNRNDRIDQGGCYVGRTSGKQQRRGRRATNVGAIASLAAACCGLLCASFLFNFDDDSVTMLPSLRRSLEAVEQQQKQAKRPIVTMTPRRTQRLKGEDYFRDGLEVLSSPAGLSATDKERSPFSAAAAVAAPEKEEVNDGRSLKRENESVVEEEDGVNSFSSIGNDDEHSKNDRVMHTFYDPIDPSKQSAPSDDERMAMDMLNVWKDSWEAKGWTTKVLTLDDAKRHPNFEDMNSKLDSIPLQGWGGTGYYNRLCYLRYLAVASVGGGWMSDYDVVALSPPLADTEMAELRKHGNGFTVFGEGGVPSLMYGTRDGWERITSGLVESGLRHTGPDVKLWSDMFALMELGKGKFDKSTGWLVEPGQYDLRDDILSGKDVLLGHDWSPYECDTIVRGRRAVHFNHGSIKWALAEGRINGDKFHGVEDRAHVIRDWFRMYRERCEGRTRPNWNLEVPDVLARQGHELDRSKEEDIPTTREA